MLSLVKTLRDGGLWQDEDVALVQDWLDDLNSIGAVIEVKGSWTFTKTSSTGVMPPEQKNFAVLCLLIPFTTHIGTDLPSPRSLTRF
ncbi:hypothetical protein Y032_0022g498 [Ancylostoma ceylanicum]|nr:hypothetical protein Y032_0022g498 [Ancylostoma ceylanicum]